jgi:hypothetical protein
MSVLLQDDTIVRPQVNLSLLFPLKPRNPAKNHPQEISTFRLSAVRSIQVPRINEMVALATIITALQYCLAIYMEFNYPQMLQQ